MSRWAFHIKERRSMQSRWLLAALAACLLMASTAVAQTQTPLALTPGIGPAPGASLSQTMYDASATSTGTTPLYVAPYAFVTITVTAIGTCSAYSLTLETVNSRFPAAWAIERTVTQTDVAANTSKVYQMSAPVMYRRVAVSSVTSCRLVVAIAGV